MKLTKFGMPVLGLIALVFAGFSVARLRPNNPPVEPYLPPPSADFKNKIGAVGLVEASSENIAVSLPVPGMVRTVYVKAGQRVAKGQNLFSLDDRDVRAELALRQTNLDLANARVARLESSPRPEEIPPAEARVHEAEAQLSDAQLQFDLMESVTDKRAIRGEDLERRRRAVQTAEAKLDEAKTSLKLLLAGSWKQDVQVAKAEAVQAAAQVARVQADLERLTVTSPIAGEILQCNVRPGEYASAGPLPQPLILLGSVDQLNIRAEVDERDAPRVREDARAFASVRGDSTRRIALRFVRFEPFVVPKKNLSNDGTERVDTRVLQVIYEMDRRALQGAAMAVRTGQQMDVMIEGR
jgi:multidrug resistance efflux pump